MSTNAKPKYLFHTFILSEKHWDSEFGCVFNKELNEKNIS